MDLMWAPGQSEAAKEICRHLTPREKAVLYGLSILLGFFGFAFPLVVMGSAVGIGPLSGSVEGFTFPLVLCFGAGFWGILVTQRRHLLATRFARDKGYTLADISTRHPLARRDYLALGVVAGLVVAIGVAAAFIIS